MQLKPERRTSLLEHALAGRAYLLFDGAMGTMLQKAGMRAGELPELLNLTHPRVVENVHRAYVRAGCDVVSANTFGASARKLAGKARVDEVFEAAVALARRSGAGLVAADIGPLGTLLKPLGTLGFDEAYEQFAEQARAARKAGADLVVVETMTDLLEMKAAVLACKEHAGLPVLATMTFGEDGRTFLGTSPEVAAATLSALGVDALGANCSLGPRALAPLVARMARYARVPLMVQANAGLPRVVDGETVFDVDPASYASGVRALIDAGATILGGCCGTTPEHMALLRGLLDACGRPSPARYRADFCICSAQTLLSLERDGASVATIGERINPTGKRRMQEALRAGDYTHLAAEAIRQQRLGADALDVNVGLPELDEPQVLVRAMEEIQAVCELPLQIDSADPHAVEAAVRRYAGKALVNSVNGKQESLEAVLPVAKRYGCAVVGLTLDEGGIPATAQKRLAIARRIVAAAESYGIPREDVVVDCLAMAASTSQEQVGEILEAIRLVKRELGVKTVLGVSNISFGLPQRELVNAVFLASAFGAGLDLAIMNPASQRMRDVVAAQRVLNAQDVGAHAFIGRYAQAADPYRLLADHAEARKVDGGHGQAGPDAQTVGGPRSDATAPDGPSGSAPSVFAEASVADDPEERVRDLVLSGLSGPMAAAVGKLLEQRDPLQAIDACLIPALDEVGARFERGEVFLPQLMASAEAAKAGFDAIRQVVGAGAAADKGAVVLATVRGDVHDIGKNIVKMLLENYGYRVYDLGRDVAPQTVLEAVRAHGVRLVGLSALMTTTVKAMQETIELLHEREPSCKVMVGGAVLNPAYAQMVGADYYAKDAAEAARVAAAFFGGGA